MDNFIDQFRSTFEFSVANAFFALSTWVAMWTGMLSFAAVTFGAVGGFTASRLYLDQDMSFLGVLVIGAILAGVAGLIFSFPLLRLESHWMALATVALILITRVAVLNLTDITGGSVGTPVPRHSNLATILALLALVAFVLARLWKSRFGIAAHSVREDPHVAAAMGVNVNAVRRIALVMSGVIGGIGGVVYADLLQYISPDTFYVSLAFLMIAAVVLGGSYHWSGPILGALVFTFLPELLRSYLAEGDEIANGILLILIMVFLPRGLIDPSRSWFRRRRPDKPESTPAPEEVTA